MGGGNVEWRMGLLNGWGYQGDAVDGAIFAGVGVLGRAPQALHHANRFLEALLTLHAVEIVAMVFIAGAASTKADIESTTAG